MANIGKFTAQANGFEGRVATLSGAFNAQIVPVPRPEDAGDDYPDYIVRSGEAEIGAAWHRHGRTSGLLYISVTIDDPSLPAPINASLFRQDDGTHNLVWNRPTRS